MSEHSHKHGECRELLKDLSDYVDGDLDETLCLEIEQHMAECDNCRVVVDTSLCPAKSRHDCLGAWN